MTSTSESEEEIDDVPSKNEAKDSLWKEHATRTSSKTGLCNHCNKTFQLCGGSVTSLRNHLLKQHKIVTGPPKAVQSKPSPIPKGQTRLNFSTSKRTIQMKKRKFNQACSRAIISGKLPMSIFEKPAMKKLMKSFVGLTGPSRRTVGRHIITERKKKEIELKLQLKKARQIDLTFDGWSSRTSLGFMVITAHYITGGGESDTKPELHSKILAFKRIKGSHTAEKIVQLIRKVLVRFDILNKTDCATTDSASTMVKVCRLLGLKRFPCFAHNLHLAVVASMKVWMNIDAPRPTLALDAESTDSDSINSDADMEDSIIEEPEQDLNSDDGDEEMVELDSDDNESSENDDSSENDGDDPQDGDWADFEDVEIPPDLTSETRIVRNSGASDPLVGDKIGAAIARARKVVVFLKKSTKQHDAFEKIAKRIDPLLSARIGVDMAVRWNSTYDMLQNLVKHKRVLDEYFFQNRRDSKIAAMSLDKCDWEALEAAIYVLGPFKSATVLLSGSQYPTLGKVSVVLDILTSSCLPCNDAGVHKELAASLRTAVLEQLRKYFSHNPRYDLSICREASFLDPACYRSLSYSQKRTASESLQATLVGLLGGTRESPTTAPSSATSPTLKKKKSTLAGFAASIGVRVHTSVPEFSKSRQAEEIVKDYESVVCTFLAKYGSDEEPHPLEFWEENYKRFPELSLYAFKRLKTPATSVPSESAFSVAGYLTRKHVAKTKPETLESRMFLSDKYV